VPADNPMTAAKVELGRHLFHDARLARDGSQSCATCHQPARAFTDGLARPTAASGALLPRSTTSLANVAYFTALTWQNPVLVRLEKHVLVPLFGNDPPEMGWNGRERELEARLATDETYRRLFAAAYPGDASPITAAHVTRSLAAFTRTIISGDARWDRFGRGDAAALTASEKRGLDLFRGDRLGCTKCHDGFTLSDAITVDRARGVEKGRFFNTGLYDVDQKGGYPPPSLGIFELSGKPEDMGKMRAATLRNVAVTAPYMHDGSIATLGEVLDVYAAGGRNVVTGPHEGDGRKSPLKSPLVTGFTLTAAEKADVLAFLGALTDETFLKDPRYADPWPR
jgi:cytochrome c peroxidase